MESLLLHGRWRLALSCLSSDLFATFFYVMKLSIRNRRLGTIVVLASVALVGVMLVATGVVASRKVSRENQLPTRDEESAKEIMYSSANDLCFFVKDQLTNNAVFDPSQTTFATSGMTLQVSGTATNPYTFAAQIFRDDHGYPNGNAVSPATG